MTYEKVSPPGALGLYETLSPIIGRIAELRYDGDFPTEIQQALLSANRILVDLVSDDVLGLIGASPEKRAAFANRLGGLRNA